jgi:hypothetical protein
MLLTQRAQLDALRALILLNAGHGDRAKHHPDAAVRQREDEIVGLLTPICKAFGTDLGVELSSTALQVFGGAGFIEETGIAQQYRDARILPIYEGTNGIQAADLVGRKLGIRQGQSALEYLEEIGSIDDALAAAGAGFATIRSGLAANLGALKKATGWLLQTRAGGDFESVLAGSVPYLRMWGLVLSAWLLAREALVAKDLGDAEFAETKLVLARFHAEQLLPAVGGLLGTATRGRGDLYALSPAQLAG